LIQLTKARTRLGICSPEALTAELQRISPLANQTLPPRASHDTALVGPGHLSTAARAIAAGSLLPSPVTLALLELDQRRSASKSDTKDTSKSSGARTAMAAVHALSKPIVLVPAFGLFVSSIG